MRNHYEEAHGIVPLEWKSGAPPTDIHGGPWIVEVWRPSLVSYTPVPRVDVHAELEVRVFVDGAWKELLWNGGLSPVNSATIVRYASLPHRWAHVNVSLDKWQSR